MTYLSGWCHPTLVDHSPCPGAARGVSGVRTCVCHCHGAKFYAVFWTDRDGVGQMEAGWEDERAARKFAKCLQTHRIASPEVQPTVRTYRGECPW